jgi:hypothetical protein
MGVKNIFNQKFISKAPNPKEEALYKRVLDEMESGKRRTGIMAKALADSLGDKDKAESLYIKYRMQTIADEDKKEAKLFLEAQKIAEEEAAEKARLAKEKKEEEDRLNARAKWRSTKRYKLINISWKFSALYIAYSLINFYAFEYSLPAITFFDNYLIPFYMEYLPPNSLMVS